MRVQPELHQAVSLEATCFDAHHHGSHRTMLADDRLVMAKCLIHEGCGNLHSSQLRVDAQNELARVFLRDIRNMSH